ncbi:MAG: hypothetical protein AB7N91_17860 [Candidatus Tectimicrobiota bacterium]
MRHSRTRYAARRAAVLEALATHLGARVEVTGANAGLHLLVWLPEVARHELPALIACAAQAGLGLYPITPSYLTAPPRAGLLLGYAALTEADLHAGIRQLARLLDQKTWWSSTSEQAQPS